MPQNQDSLVHFTLKRVGWGYDDIYEALKTGQKTSEYRPGSRFWVSRLLTESGIKNLSRAHEIHSLPPEHPDATEKPYFLMDFPEYQWKHKKARFVIGYTKYPRLLADITNILYKSETNQFEIRIRNVVEETEQQVSLGSETR